MSEAEAMSLDIYIEKLNEIRDEFGGEIKVFSMYDGAFIPQIEGKQERYLCGPWVNVWHDKGPFIVVGGMS